MKPVELRCEYRRDPIGIDSGRPRLSWTLESDRRGAKQTAFRITVRPANDPDAPPHWDSGKVDSGSTSHIEYRGPLLGSRGSWQWDVEVWDENGDSVKSDPARFEMGLIGEDAWAAEWISLRSPGSNDEFRPAPHIRRTFELKGEFENARLHVTALGLYEAYVNGERVGSDRLTPGWTDYDHRIQYETYDVTYLLREGENCLALLLGDGWYSGFVGGQHMRARWGDHPAARAQLEIETSKEDVTVVTDSSWRGWFGAIQVSDLLMGETYNAQQEIVGWNLPGFDDSSWNSVAVQSPPSGALVARKSEPVRATEELPAVTVAEPIEGSWVFDLGQNMVGWVRVEVEGEKGDTVTIRHAEMLNPDGTIYTENLRGADCVDRYILKGEGKEIYEPTFTFHGFRYVELSGLRTAPDKSDVTGIVAHSDCEATGQFECSNDLLNQLQRNIVWGQRGNFLEVPTDCPQRDERLGWMGDAQIFARTATFNMDVGSFFTKWMDDVADAQNKEGAFPNVAPKIKALGATTGWNDALDAGAPGWGDAGVIVPWTMYQVYGDRRILESHFDAMVRWVRFVESCSPGLLWTEVKGWNFGDWLSIGADSPVEVLATAYFAYTTGLVAKIARIIGREAEAEIYGSLAAEIKSAFNKAYVRDDGSVEGETQTIYALALEFDLLPQELREPAAKHLVADIEAKDWHLSTGFLGVTHLLPALSNSGYLDVAYRLLTNTTYPSWLYPVMHGATTIWERWDGWTEKTGFQSPGMNSFNHYAYGSVGQWMYANIGGIDLDPERPGFEHIIVRPRPGGGITHASVSYRSIRGPISVEWNQTGAEFQIEVEIPANAEASVHLPVGGTVRESGSDLQSAEGIQAVETRAGLPVIRIGSGRYRFTVEG